MLEGMSRDGEPPGVAVDPLDVVDELHDPGRAVDRERGGALHVPERLDDPEDAEEVIGVPVRDEDGIDGEPGLRTHHLLLGALPAVEEQGVGAPPDQYAGGVPLR